MARRIVTLAWSAAASTYLLIVLGAVVRITGSGMGCGDDWPVCHGRLVPSLADIATLIETCSRGITLLPGDIIATGTPDGVGAATGNFLRAGDRIEAEVEGIGILASKVVRP